MFPPLPRACDRMSPPVESGCESKCESSRDRRPSFPVLLFSVARASRKSRFYDPRAEYARASKSSKLG